MLNSRSVWLSVRWWSLFLFLILSFPQGLLFQISCGSFISTFLLSSALDSIQLVQYSFICPFSLACYSLLPLLGSGLQFVLVCFTCSIGPLCNSCPPGLMQVFLHPVPVCFTCLIGSVFINCALGLA